MPKNPLSTSIKQCENAHFATLFLPLFSIFLCPILPLFSTLYISLWDAMNKLWCGPIGYEFKRWRVGINKGGGEIDGHKENSQDFRANFFKGIGCSM
jgi:hypothetical protein